MTVRSKLLITIGVLYLAALLGIGVYAERSKRVYGGLYGRPVSTYYERETITTAIMLATLAMAIAVVGALWMKPKHAGAQLAGLDNDIDAAESGADPATPSEARTSESLRHLKALHAEGILTDAEYEAKRTALVNRL